MILNVNDNFLLAAGVNLKLFDTNLNLLDECVRKNKENSIKFLITIKNDRIVIATNFDIEIFAIINANNDENVLEDENSYKLVELKQYYNTHKENILALEIISG